MTNHDLQELVDMALWALGRPIGPAFSKMDVELPLDPVIEFHWEKACGALRDLWEHLENSKELV